MVLSRDKRQVLVVSTWKRSSEIITKLTNSDFADYEIIGFVLKDSDHKGEKIGGYPVLGKLDRGMEYIHTNVVDEVFVHLEAGQFLEKEYIDILCKKLKVMDSSKIKIIPYGQGQVMHLEADISKLKKDTGWLPKVSFEDGIEQVIQFYRKRIE